METPLLPASPWTPFPDASILPTLPDEVVTQPWMLPYHGALSDFLARPLVLLPEFPSNPAGMRSLGHGALQRVGKPGSKGSQEPLPVTLSPLSPLSSVCWPLCAARHFLSVVLSPVPSVLIQHIY